MLLSCRRSNAPDVSGIDVNVEVKRFEQELFAIPPDSIPTCYSNLSSEFGSFAHLFGEGIIGAGKRGNPMYYNMIQRFVTDTMILKLRAKVMATFPDTKNLDSELTDAFRRFRYYFPANEVPSVYTFISGFNLSIGIDSGAVVVGLDRYLGEDSPYYSRLGIPKYMQYKMTPKKIPSDVVRAWVLAEFPFNDSIDNIMTHMVWEGGLMYITQQLLPDQDLATIFGFTPAQMKFCRSNERLMWTYLVEHKLLFSTKALDITKYINDAPFTSGFPQESPGRATVWLGYRIVESYMKNNEGATLGDLVRITDYSRILNGAKYRP